MSSTITPHPQVSNWAGELSTAIVAELFGQHAPQMIREKVKIEFVCSEYLQQFWDASEHKVIAEMGTKLGYDACKDDVVKIVEPSINKAWDLYKAHATTKERHGFSHEAHELSTIRSAVQQLDFKKREIVIVTPDPMP